MNLNLNYIRSLDKRILIIGGSLIGVMILVLTFIIVTMVQVDISNLEETLPRPLVIIDKNGEIVSEQSSVNFTTVSLSEIPEDLIAAIIAVEDNRFYKHAGVDVIGLSLIHISEPTRLGMISYAVFCLKKKKEQENKMSE